MLPVAMTASLTIAVLQREIRPLDPPGNLLAALDMLRTVAKQGVDLFVLTELWSTGVIAPDSDSATDLAEDIGGPTVEALSDFCRESKSHLLAGTLAIMQKGVLKNTALLLDPSGKIVLQYAKTQLFGPMGEDKTYTPGDHLSATDVNGIGVGVLICYDLRFPTLARRLAQAGCEIILVPALWPEARIEHWETLIKARAIENQVFVAGANGILNQDKEFCPGHSLIVGPNGEMLNSPEMRETAIVRKLNLLQLRELRRRISYIDEEREIKDVKWTHRSHAG
jgi:predicted amidohydrolase